MKIKHRCGHEVAYEAHGSTAHGLRLLAQHTPGICPDCSAAMLRLMAEALESCQWREHRMGAWGVNGTKASCACRMCGRTAYVNVTPLPNETEIGGAAVAINCNGRR